MTRKTKPPVSVPMDFGVQASVRRLAGNTDAAMIYNRLAYYCASNQNQGMDALCYGNAYFARADAKSLHETFDFIPERTIHSHLQKLERVGLIVQPVDAEGRVVTLGKTGMDRRRFYTVINPEWLAERGEDFRPDLGKAIADIADGSATSADGSADIADGTAENCACLIYTSLNQSSYTSGDVSKKSTAGTGKTTGKADSETTDAFERFWKEVAPKLSKSRRGSKSKALGSFRTAAREAGEGGAAKVAMALIAFYRDPEVSKKNYQFAPMPTTAINQRRFEPHLAGSQPTGGAYGPILTAGELKNRATAYVDDAWDPKWGELTEQIKIVAAELKRAREEARQAA